MSVEEQRECLFALKGSFLDLLAALFTFLRARLQAPETASEAQGDARELLRVIDLGILEPIQVHVKPKTETPNPNPLRLPPFASPMP